MTCHPAIARAIEASEANEARQAAEREHEYSAERQHILGKLRKITMLHDLTIEEYTDIAIRIGGVWFTNLYHRDGGFMLQTQCPHGEYQATDTLIRLGDVLRGLACHCVEMNDKENGPPC